MSIIWTLVIGLVIGAVAKLVVPGKQGGGIIVTMLLGLAGSLVANFLGRALNIYRDGETAGFIAGVIGAVILIVAYGAVMRRRNSEPAQP